MELKKKSEVKAGVSAVFVNELKVRVLLHHLHMQRIIGRGIAIEYKPATVKL